MNESAVASLVRHAFADVGPLWRNNVGVAEDKTGRVIRYGLSNESAATNAAIKSSDLIGVTPLFIGPQHVGRIVGVFTAIETKASDWKFSERDERAIAQRKFHQIVQQAGGYAGFATGVADIYRIIGWTR